MMNAIQFGATLKKNAETTLLNDLKHTRNIEEWLTIDAETQTLKTHFADKTDKISLSFHVDKDEDGTNFSTPRYITPILHLPAQYKHSAPLELTRFEVSSLIGARFVTELFAKMTEAIDNKIATLKAEYQQ